MNFITKSILLIVVASAITVASVKAEETEYFGESRAAREELSDPCNNCDDRVVSDRSTNIVQQLCALQCCCAEVAHRLEKQGKEAQRCCKKLTHKIDHVEDLVESVIDETTVCCSVTEGLLVSIIDQEAVCCSVTEGLLVSIIDQEAVCCSVIESALGDPATASFLDIPLCVPMTFTDALINATDADVLAWLKSIYELVYRVHLCTCCAG